MWNFSKICKKRTGLSTYEGTCDALSDDTYFATYAANSSIDSEDNINIYDGLNGYTDISEKLTKFDYFTDSEKLLSGSDRNEIFYLAPNSITKIRVYIWLEGQDVDNFDFASLGEKITVVFGFTKERYTTEEIDSGISVPSDIGNEELPETN